MAKKVPLRQCLGCREMMPKSELIRIVEAMTGSSQLMQPASSTEEALIYARNPSALRRRLEAKHLRRLSRSAYLLRCMNN